MFKPFLPLSKYMGIFIALTLGQSQATMLVPTVQFQNAPVKVRLKPNTPTRESGFVYVQIQQGETLGDIANAYGTPVKAIQHASALKETDLSLNQWLRVPVRAERQENRQLPPGVLVHIVRSGDSLSLIRSLYSVSTLELISANPYLPSLDHMSEGTEVLIPSAQKGLIVRIKKGEDVLSIAQFYRVDVGVVAKANNLTSPTDLQVGDLVLLPGVMAEGTMQALNERRQREIENERKREIQERYERYLVYLKSVERQKLEDMYQQQVQYDKYVAYMDAKRERLTAIYERQSKYERYMSILKEKQQRQAEYQAKLAAVEAEHRAAEEAAAAAKRAAEQAAAKAAQLQEQARLAALERAKQAAAAQAAAERAAERAAAQRNAEASRRAAQAAQAASQAAAQASRQQESERQALLKAQAAAATAQDRANRQSSAAQAELSRIEQQRAAAVNAINQANSEAADARAQARREQIRLEAAQAVIREREAAASAPAPRRASVASAPRVRRASYGSEGFVWPMRSFTLTSGYGYRNIWIGRSNFHTGLDMAAPIGTPIYAAKGGYVSQSGYGAYGLNVFVDDGNMRTIYGHMSRTAVRYGAYVERGQLVGYVGCTGFCTGPHLHFEVRVNNRHVNPYRYLP